MKKSKIIKGGKEAIIVTAILSHLKGNKRPYFSITANIGEKRTGRRNGDDRITVDGEVFLSYMGGCCHEEIEKYFPGEFTDLIALHLSDDEGSPTYAAENGFYHLKNALGVYRVFATSDLEPAKPASILSNHLRISEAETQAIIDKVSPLLRPELQKELGDTIKNTEHAIYVLKGVVKAIEKLGDEYAEDAKKYSSRISALEHEVKVAKEKLSGFESQAKQVFTAYVDSLRPRWKEEANAAILKHGLTVVQG